MNNLTCLRPEMLLTSAAFTNYRILQYIYLSVAVLTLTTNLSILVVFIKLQYFKTRHHQFLLTLTATDLLASFTVEPLISYDFMLLSRGHNNCNISNATRMLGSTLCFMSITTIVLINGEQYMAIVRPFRPVHCLKLTMFGEIVLIWALFIVVAFFSIYIFPKVMFQIFKIGFSVMVMLIFLVLCYTQIKINREIARIAAVKNVGGQANEIEQNRLLIRTSRMAKSILLLFGLCFTPLVVVSCFQIFLTNKAFFSTYYQTWSYLVLYLNSLMNPLVYCVRLKSVRRSIVSGF